MAKWAVEVSDRNYVKKVLKTFTESSKDAPDTAERAAREYARQVEAKDNRADQGKYRSIRAVRVDDSFKNQAFSNGRSKAEAYLNSRMKEVGVQVENAYSEAFAEGITAARKKASIVDNPHPPNSQEWIDWKRGWKKQFEASQGLRGI